MSENVPPWLATMREITGTIEVSGPGNNPVIVGWAKRIGEIFPEMASYCAQYNADAIPWCGLTVGYVMAVNGIRPPFGPTDTDRFLWAQAWKQFGEPTGIPQLGDVLVLAGHVTLFDGIDSDGYYLCRGGNQSDGVRVSRFSRASIEAIRRPPTASVTALPKPTSKRQTGIVATVWSDAMGAYGPIDHAKPAASLPAHFPRASLPVLVLYGPRGSVLAPIRDVGPWYDGRSGWPEDPYWQTGTRPRAETDDRTNSAGIDINPAAAAAIGIDGKGAIDWEFLTSEQTVTDPSRSPDQAAPAPAPVPVPMPPTLSIDWDRIERLANTVETIAHALAQAKLQVQPPLALPAPAPAAAAPAATPAPTSTMGLGTGILGLIGSVIAAKTGTIGMPVGDASTMVGALAPMLSGALAVLGAFGKVSPAVGMVSTVLSALAGLGQKKS